MALTLDIPVRTSITLPDNWQDCQTPQQLSYWLIAKFNEVATTHDITELRQLVSNFEIELNELINQADRNEANITQLQLGINGISTRLGDVESLSETNSLGLNTLDRELTDLNNSVKALEDIQYISALSNNVTFTIANWLTRRFFVRCGGSTTNVRFTFPSTGELRAGEYIEIITSGDNTLSDIVQLHWGAFTVSLDAVPYEGIRVYRLYWDGYGWSSTLQNATPIV